MPEYTFEGFELDRALYQLRRDGEPLDLGPRIFDVLAYLIDNRERIVSRMDPALWSFSQTNCAALVLQCRASFSHRTASGFRRRGSRRITHFRLMGTQP